MTINVIPRWVSGAPETFEAGQFLVYESGGYELVGCRFKLSFDQKIVKHTTLIEPHELDWLKSMAAGRSLGVGK